MNNASATLEQSITVLAGQLQSINDEAKDIVKAYFSTGASSLVGGLAPSTAVTVSTQLTQAKYVNGITLCQAIQDWIGAQAVGQNDYNSSIQNLLHGSNPAQAVLSNDVESLGSRMVSLAGTLITQFKAANQILSIYSTAQLSAMLGAASGDPVVPGCSTAKTKFLNGINLVQQYANLIGAQAVAQGDYLSIINAWIQGV